MKAPYTVIVGNADGDRTTYKAGEELPVELEMEFKDREDKLEKYQHKPKTIVKK